MSGSAAYLDFQSAQSPSRANRDKAERKRAPESVRRAVGGGEGGGGTRVKEDSFAARANWLAISLRERALTAPRTFVTFAPVTVGLFLSRQAPAAVTRKQGDALCGSIAEQIARPNLRGFFSPSAHASSRYRAPNLVAIMLPARAAVAAAARNRFGRSEDDHELSH